MTDKPNATAKPAASATEPMKAKPRIAIVNGCFGARLQINRMTR